MDTRKLIFITLCLLILAWTFDLGKSFGFDPTSIQELSSLLTAIRSFVGL